VVSESAMSIKESKEKIAQAIILDQSIKDAMKNLGFTEYYIQIYTTLIVEGEMNANELSERTGVNHSRIYDMLNEMIKRHMILRLDGRPNTFIAQNPQEMLQGLKKNQDDDFQQNMQMALNFLLKLRDEPDEIKQISVTLHAGDKPCMEYLRNNLNLAIKSVNIAFMDFDEILPEIEKNFDFLHGKNVLIRAIVEESLKGKSDFINTLEKYAEIRYYPILTNSIVIVDEKNAIQTMKGHFNIAKPAETNYSLLASSHLVYVMFINECFTNIWNTSQPK
jgi:sugar-specific transcriptional regulator TrmB